MDKRGRILILEIGWIKRLFTAWRVSHTERTERRAERKEDGEDDSEEDEPVEIQLSDVTHDASEGDPSAGIIRRGTVSYTHLTLPTILLV